MFKDYRNKNHRTFDEVFNNVFDTFPFAFSDDIKKFGCTRKNSSYDDVETKGLYYSLKFNKDENRYELEQDLPGVKESDIEITVTDKNQIKINATRYRNDEVLYSKTFLYSVSKDYDLENATAKLEDGILYVMIPVKENEIKKIPIINHA